MRFLCIINKNFKKITGAFLMQNPYANFWRRVAAFLIDNIVLAIPMWMLTGFFYMYYMPQVMLNKTEEEMAAVFPLFFLFTILSNLFFFVLFILYTSIMESSSKQATLGKMALGIKVVDKNGQRLRFWHAVGRNLGKVVSYFIMYFGFFMAAFTRRRQGLHDMMASTFVVNEAYQPGQPLPEEPFRTGCLVSTIAVILLPFVLGIIAVIMIPFLVETANTQTAYVRLLQTQMDALRGEDITQDNPLQINNISFYIQDGDVYAAQTQPEAFTVRLPLGEKHICCVEEEGNFCQLNEIKPCM